MKKGKIKTMKTLLTISLTTEKPTRALEKNVKFKT